MAEAGTAPRFKIGSKVYKLDPNLDKVSLLDIITYDEQIASVGLHATWGQTMQWAAEVAELDADDRMSHPRAYLVLTATVWASRRLSKEKVDFGAMLADLDATSIEWLTEDAGPKDHLPPKRSRARKASAAATSAPDVDEQSTTPETSSPTSETGSST